MFGKSIVTLVVTVLATSVVAVGVVAAGSISENNGSPTDLLGGEMLSCPDGTQVQSRFSRNGDAWEVTGILSTGLVGMITVAGPQGDVSATPTVNIVVSGDPQPGEIVTMAGTIPAVTGEMVATSIAEECPGIVPAPAAEVPPPAAEVAAETDEPDDEEVEDETEGVCNRGAGQSGEVLMHENNGGVHIQRGQVMSIEDETLSVQTPEGTMVVMINDDTHLNGDAAAGAEVKVRGERNDGVLIADEVKVLCPNPHGEGNEGDDDEQGKDDDGEGGHGKDKHEDKDKDED